MPAAQPSRPRQNCAAPAKACVADTAHTQAGKAPARFQALAGAPARAAPPLTKTVPFGFAPLPAATDQTSSRLIRAAGAAAPEQSEWKLPLPLAWTLSIIAHAPNG